VVVPRIRQNGYIDYTVFIEGRRLVRPLTSAVREATIKRLRDILSHNGMAVIRDVLWDDIPCPGDPTSWIVFIKIELGALYVRNDHLTRGAIGDPRPRRIKDNIRLCFGSLVS
jgi:hypothetical protein